MQTDISIEQARVLYKQGGLAKKLALSLFNKKDLLPTAIFSWDSFKKNYPYIIKEYYIATNSSICSVLNEIRTNEDKNLLSSKDQAKAILALIQLLRFYESWSYSSTTIKYGVIYKEKEFKIVDLSELKHTPVFTFCDKSMAQDFINTFSEYFKDLLYLYER